MQASEPTMTTHTDTKGHSVSEMYREYKLKYVLDYEQNTRKMQPSGLGLGLGTVLAWGFILKAA